MKAPNGVLPLSGIVSVWPEHQKPSNAGRQESARRCSSGRYVSDAEQRYPSCMTMGCAQHVTRRGSSRRTELRQTASVNRYEKLNRLMNTSQQSASMRECAKRTPVCVKNIVYPIVEISSICLKICLKPGQSDKRQSILPGTKEELFACSIVGTALAVLVVGVPALLSLLYLGGVF